jgi:hypothetical protein
MSGKTKADAAGHLFCAEYGLDWRVRPNEKWRKFGLPPLQAQVRHRLAHGLQTLFSYTWAHSIDDVSSDVHFVNVRPGVTPSGEDRGPSDYDIRHTFSGAASYDIPEPGGGIGRSLLGNWSTDSIVYVRSAPHGNIVMGRICLRRVSWRVRWV